MTWRLSVNLMSNGPMLAINSINIGFGIPKRDSLCGTSGGALLIAGGQNSRMHLTRTRVRLLYRYKITATIPKAGGTPIEWTHYSKTKLTPQQCENRLFVAMVKECSKAELVKLSNFRCVQVHANDVIVKES